jgi:TetR/AcrR family transcriptional regulator, repressor of fatR-cypB operon
MARPRCETTRNATREQILQSALHLFSSQGYFNTSIHDIQKASGVSIGSVYNHFSGKGAIARALYDHLLERMERLVDGILADNVGACARCRAMVAALFDMTEREPETMAFILNARHQEFLGDRPHICSSRPFARMRDIVIDGMEDGEVRRLDPWVVASLAFGPALRLIALRLDGLLEQAPGEQLDALWEATWESIAAPTAKGGLPGRGSAGA